MSNLDVAFDSRAPSPRPEVEVSGLSKSYQGRAVLSNVSFVVPEGQAVSLIGSNGAGKSTLLRCCLRLVEPDAGGISLLGERVDGAGQRRLRRVRSRVGFVFQKHNLVPRLSVLSNVIHGAQARGSGVRSWFHWAAPRALREEAMHCLDLVGLADIAGRRADRLSGGQSQRVAIARAFMQHPKMFFADEPVASLDPKAGEEVMALFAELMRRKKMTLVYTSHNVEHALRYADRVLGLRNGDIEMDAETRVLSHERIRSIYGAVRC